MIVNKYLATPSAINKVTKPTSKITSSLLKVKSDCEADTGITLLLLCFVGGFTCGGV